MKPYLNDLNESQLKAVLHEDGPMLVFAGAGSGKTRVLTRRICNLIDNNLAYPENIFAVTFTNKAANEMKERVFSMLGRAPRYVSTFHSACAKILRENARLLGFRPDFTIYDQKESLSTIKRIFKNLKINSKEITPSEVQRKIDRAKNNYLFPDHFRNSETFYDREQNIIIADIYEAYQKELLQCNAMDFGDLICHVVTLFILEKDTLNKYKNRFKYVLVDEYQDTNIVQYKLLNLLTKDSQNLFVVGDDDQSIYSFRGANIANIDSFKRDYPEHEICILDINYRSTKNILDAANAVIAHNDSRETKYLKTDREDGEAVNLKSAECEVSEAQFIAQTIKTGDIPLNEIAIFYRTNAQSRALEEELYHQSIHHRIFGGQRFYDRKEIKDIIAYCRLALNNDDNESFIRVINVPSRGFGKTSLNHLLKKAKDEETSLFKASLTKVKGLGTRADKSLNSFTKQIEKYSLLANKVNNNELELSEFLQNIIEDSGYLNSLKQNVEDIDRVENVLELLSVANSFSQKNKIEESEEELPILIAFLERASLNSSLDKNSGKDSEQDYVSLMTLHLAKGLEYEMVFLCGLEEGILPHSRSLEDLESLEEERRLCYVGITRAKSSLYLSYARDRSNTSYNTWNFGICSRFLGEIPEEHIEIV